MREPDLQPILSSLLRKQEHHHAVLAATRGDGTPIWAGAGGEADTAGRPMTLETPYFIASVTKLAIATVTLRLSETGNFRIDEPFLNRIGNLPAERIHRLKGVDYTPRITILNLLSHTSGLPDYIEDRPGSGPRLIDRMLSEDDRPIGTEEVCGYLRDKMSPHFPPQDMNSTRRIRTRYSDTNFRLLIALIEATTGRPWSAVVAAELAEPLGLKNTWAAGAKPPAGSPPPASVWNGEEPLERPRLMESLGDLYSTVSDQILLLRSILGGQAFRNPGTEDLIHRNWHSLAFDPFSPRLPGWPIKYGLGMMHFRLPGWLPPFKPVPAVIGHTGSTGCWLFYCPELDIYLCGNVSQISAGAVPFRVIPRILRYWL